MVASDDRAAMRVDWLLASPIDLSRVDGPVDGVLHAVQRQHPAAESVWLARRPGRIRPWPSPVDRRRLRQAPHEHGLDAMNQSGIGRRFHADGSALIYFSAQWNVNENAG